MTSNTPTALHTLAWDSLLPPPPDVGHTEDCQGCELERLRAALEEIAALPENGLGGTGAAPRIALEALYGS